MRPLLVNHAIEFSQTLGFQNSCIEEVGEFLYVFAGHIRVGKIAEIGTGCGVGTSWIASATSCEIYTVDHDDKRISGVQELFAQHENVHPFCADWEAILEHGPFELVFVDAKPAKLEGIDKVVNATAVGGFIILDDLTPVEFWPDEWKGQSDKVRELWLNHPRLASIEIRTSLKSSVILARRVD